MSIRKLTVMAILSNSAANDSMKKVLDQNLAHQYVSAIKKH